MPRLGLYRSEWFALNFNCIKYLINHQDARNLHAFKWYKGLYEYSRPGVGKIAEERELGPDGDLVASMISTAVIPIICNVIDNGALDVYSQHNIRRIIDLAEEIESSVEADAGKFQVRLTVDPCLHSEAHW